MPTVATAPEDTTTTGELVLTVKAERALLAKLPITIRQGQVSGATPFTLSTAKGQRLYFEFNARDPALRARLTTGVGIAYGAYDPATNSATPVPHAFTSAVAVGLFAQPYRGWAVFGYNGNGEWAGRPLDEGVLYLPDGESYANDTARRVYVFYPRPADNAWRGPDEDTWVGPSAQSSSRLGIDYIQVPDGARYTGARAPDRIAHASQNAVGGGYGGSWGSVNASTSTGDSHSVLDFLDLNGDRFPDIVGGTGRVQYTTPDGGLEARNTPVPNLGAIRQNANLAVNGGVGGNVAISLSDGRGSVDPAGPKPATTGKQGSDMPTLGLSMGGSWGVSGADYDLIDLNGDGLPDRVRRAEREVKGIKVDYLRVRLNLGYRFAEEEEWGLGSINAGASKGLDGGVSGGFNDGIYGFGGGLNLGLSKGYTQATLLDINGDGLPDWVEQGSPLRVALNTGAGFAAPILWKGALTDDVSRTVNARQGVGGYFTYAQGPLCAVACWIIINPGAHTDDTAARQEVAVRDLDGDGYPDQLVSSNEGSLRVALSAIGRTNLLQRIERPLGAVITLDYARRGNTYKQPHSQWVLARVAVHDGHAGDGADVRATAYEYAGGYYDRREREFYGYATVTERQLDTAHEDAVYRTITREYRTDSFYTKGLLARELTADGADKSYLETVHTYRLLDVATGQEFANPASTNPASLTARVFPQLERTERHFYEGADKPVKTTYVTYAYDAWGNVSGYLDAGEPDTRDDDVYAELVYTGTDPAHAACGERHIVGLPTAITVRPAPGRGPVLRERRGTYNCTSGALTRLRRRVEDPAARTGTAWAEHDFGYDAYGNLERLTGPVDANGKRHVLVFGYDAAVATYPARIETREAGHTKYHSTARYDYRFGVPEETIDLNGNPLTQQYDAYGRLIAVRGPYEQAAGSPPTLRFDYHPEAAVPHARTQHFDRDAEGHAQDPIETLRFVDGLTRVLQTKKDITRYVPGASAGEAAMSVSGRLRFDALGRVAEQYYPSWEKKGANTAFSGSTATESPTKTAYDVLDRPLSITLPDESVTRHAYGFGALDGRVQFVTETVDAEANRRAVYRDVRALIVAVREANPKGGQPALTTRYRYDRLGQLDRVTDAAGHVTAVGYDTLGRRTRLHNPDTGLIAWRYDRADNLIARVTPKLRAQGQAIAYRYDYNRLTAIDYPNGTGHDVRYTYGDDTKENRAAGRVGRITRVEHESGYEERWYGKLGEAIQETKSVHLPQSAWHSGAKHTQGTTQPEAFEVFTTQYDYDSFGRLLRLVYPDGETLTYRYDAGGLPESVHGTYKGAPYAYVKRIGYDEFESRVHVALGNGAVSDYRYDPATRRLATLATQSAGYQFQNLTYAYDRIGNVTALVNDVAVPADGFGGYVQQRFGYDNLSRLTEAAGTYQGTGDRREEYSLVMAYDGIHNITQKHQAHRVISLTGSGTKHATTYSWDYKYEGAQPHAPTHIGERTFSYDANGNQTGWRHDQNATRRAISWDDADRIRAIEDRGGERSTYGYDDQGQRVIKQARQNLTVYVNPYFTERNGAIGSKHVFVGNTRLVTKVTGGTTFIRSYEGYTGTKTPPGQAKRADKANKAADKGNNGRHLGQAKDHTDRGQHLGQAKQAEKGNAKGQEQANLGKGQEKGNAASTPTRGAHPGQGLAHRSDRANEVAQNTCRNKRLAPLYCPDAGGGDTPPEDGTDPGEETPGTPPAQELIKVSMGEQLFYYHPDHLGSTSYVTRENGKVHEHLQYFPFGETWIQQGGNTEKSPYLFTAKELDEETGLYYFGARYYDPRTSVWVSADPVLDKYLDGAAGGLYETTNLGLYTYARNNPVRVADPDGNMPPLFRLVIPRPAPPPGGYQPHSGDTSTETPPSFPASGRERPSREDITRGRPSRGPTTPPQYEGRPLDDSLAGELAAPMESTANSGEVNGVNATAGGGASVENIPEAAQKRIQDFVNKKKVVVTVVGSRAAGTATSGSDWDYVIGGNSKTRQDARRELPRGTDGGEVGPRGPTGIDVFNANTEKLDTTKPHVIFKPSGSE